MLICVVSNYEKLENSWERYYEIIDTDDWVEERISGIVLKEFLDIGRVHIDNIRLDGNEYVIEPRCIVPYGYSSPVKEVAIYIGGKYIAFWVRGKLHIMDFGSVLDKNLILGTYFWKEDTWKTDYGFKFEYNGFNEYKKWSYEVHISSYGELFAYNTSDIDYDIDGIADDIKTVNCKSKKDIQKVLLVGGI